MKVIRENTFIHVLTDNRIRHCRVTEVTDQDTIMAQVGKATAFNALRETSGTGVTTTRGFLFVED